MELNIVEWNEMIYNVIKRFQMEWNEMLWNKKWNVIDIIKCFGIKCNGIE